MAKKLPLANEVSLGLGFVSRPQLESRLRRDTGFDL